MIENEALSNRKSPLISVIIPTYNRVQLLLQALCSLQNQRLTNFEIIVVDNAADPHLARTMAMPGQFPRVPVRYIAEPRLGLHFARHAGAHAATGELLVFTDDDATFDPSWLRAYLTAFDEHPEMAAAGGPARPVWEQPPPQWLFALMSNTKKWGTKMFGPLSLIMDKYDTFQLGAGAFFWGVNMAIRRSALFEVGGFNPECYGETWLGDGESGLRRKLDAREMLVGYVPQAAVYHHIPADRMTVQYLCRRMTNEGAAEVYARYYAKVPSQWDLLKHALTIVGRYSGLWFAARVVAGGTGVRCLRIEMDAFRTRSQLKYVLQLMRDKNLRQLIQRKDWLTEAPVLASSSA